MLKAHGILAGVEVPIAGRDGPYGLLAAYSRDPRRFTREDANFVRSLANTLAAAKDRKAAEERLAYVGQFDTLTGLPNRSLFLDRCSQSLIQVRRNGGSTAVVCINLDRFKPVNDTLGHRAGNVLLLQVAQRLRQCIRPGDTVGRMNGDEFAFVLAGLARADDAALVAQKVSDALAPLFALEDGQEVYVSASLGMSVFPADGDDAKTMLKNAGTAMSRAKQRGPNGRQFYLPEMNARVAERLGMETKLRGALERGEFTLQYQPKADLRSGAISGFEALLRWQDPRRGLVPPQDFIAILEDTGLIVPVGEWVVRAVCEQLRRWRADGVPVRPVAINLSARQFQQGHLDVTIARILADTGVSAGLLEFELTESMLMADPDETAAMLRNLKAQGVRLSVDDFGTGYSSLARLRRFPIDALKIDRVFVRDIATDPDDASIALAIINLAHSLKLKVVAEGVETAAQLEFLRAHGCDEMQGYLFAPPLAVGDCTRALTEARHLQGAVPLSRARDRFAVTRPVELDRHTTVL